MTAMQSLPSHYRWAGGLLVDNFAGGGGASTGIFAATGRSPDIAVNHNAEALMMHQENHPTTKHYNESVWDIDIHEAPRVSAVSDATLEPGFVVTVEPGVYIAPHGGVRIEDTVVVTETGCTVLTASPKTLLVA